MSKLQNKKQELARKGADSLIQAKKESDVRDILLDHANLKNKNGKTNLEAVLESFTELAINAESEQVRSQTSIQYLKFLAKPQEEGEANKMMPSNNLVQITINPVKAETTIEQ